MIRPYRLRVNRGNQRRFLIHDVGYDGSDLGHPFHGDVDVTVIAELADVT
jgi:hypothetical protein